jgi:hypothetical protein
MTAKAYFKPLPDKNNELYSLTFFKNIKVAKALPKAS